MRSIDLRGKPIAITGASSGIGAATAMRCAAAGMPVVLGARRIDKLEEVAAAITRAGGSAAAVAVDVTRPEDCRRFIDRTAERFGSVYAVFANAGYGLEAPIADMTDEAMRQIFETNLYGTLNTIAPALPRMLRAGRGHILICSSCIAKMTLPYYGAYSASKAAQNHVGRAMNLELRRTGVRVSTVHPVGTRTEFFDTVRKLNGGMKIVDHTPDRFMQPPERVADAIVRCLRRPRPEVWTSRFVRLGMAFCNAFPGVEDRWIAWMLEKRRRNLGQPED